MTNSLKAIESEILRDAKAEAKKQLQLAKERAEQKIQGKKQELEKAFVLRSTLNTEEAARKKERLLTSARLEQSKERLQAKQEMIDLAFSKVAEAFAAMDVDTHKDWLERLMLATSETGVEVVVPGKREVALVDEALLTRVNEQLKRSKRPGSLVLSEQTGEFDQGFVLLGEQSEINASLEALINSVRKDLESDVAGILFG